MLGRETKMPQEELPRPSKRALRSLSHQAHEAELGRALHELSRHFDGWKAGEIDSFELSTESMNFMTDPTGRRTFATTAYCTCASWSVAPFKKA